MLYKIKYRKITKAVVRAGVITIAYRTAKRVMFCPVSVILTTQIKQNDPIYQRLFGMATYYAKQEKVTFDQLTKR